MYGVNSNTLQSISGSPFKYYENLETPDVFTNAAGIISYKALLQFFGQESFPCRVTSDRGSAFTSDIIAALSQEVGIRLAMTVAQRAQGNGLVERPHRFLKAAIQMFANDGDGLDWPEILPLLSLVDPS